jgi:hypothetical protein
MCDRYRATFAAVFIVCMLVTPAFAVELFRYRGAAMDGGTLEYVFETDEKEVPKTATKEKVAEIAADTMTTFYGLQTGALETQEFRTTPVPFWLVCYSDTVKRAIHQLFFVVVLPNGTVVEQACQSDSSGQHHGIGWKASRTYHVRGSCLAIWLLNELA